MIARAHWVGAAAGAAVTAAVACLAGAGAEAGGEPAVASSRIGRYQIAAESGAGGRVWIVDTATGRVWYRSFNGGPDWHDFGSPIGGK